MDRAHASAAHSDTMFAVDQVDHVDATVQALLGDTARARELLAQLVERNEALGRRRFADRYRRDLDALGTPDRD